MISYFFGWMVERAYRAVLTKQRRKGNWKIDMRKANMRHIKDIFKNNSAIYIQGVLKFMTQNTIASF